MPLHHPQIKAEILLVDKFKALVCIKCFLNKAYLQLLQFSGVLPIVKKCYNSNLHFINSIVNCCLLCQH